MAISLAPADVAKKDAFVNDLLGNVAGTFRVFSIYLGHRLGFYRELANGAATPPELARRAGTDPRYTREWLEQQTVAGILAVENATAAADARRFSLPAAHAEALVNAESLDYMAPLMQLVVGAVKPVGALVEAYRTGEGIAYGDFGEDLRVGQAGMNRTMFLQLLPSEWLPAIPDVHARLSKPGAKVADVGCGAGWSSIGIARGYAGAVVDGIDLDAPSVDLANANAKAAGLEGRLTFHARDAADPALRGKYDLVTAFECIHDMSQPVKVLQAMRGLVAPGGAVLVVDERVGERFTAEGEGLEWMMYGWSVLHCLPVGLADKPSEGTGTVLRPAVLAEYARRAGFARTEVLPIENPFFRIYRLHP